MKLLARNVYFSTAGRPEGARGKTITCFGPELHVTRSRRIQCFAKTCKYGNYKRCPNMDSLKHNLKMFTPRHFRGAMWSNKYTCRAQYYTYFSFGDAYVFRAFPRHSPCGNPKRQTRKRACRKAPQHNYGIKHRDVRSNRVRSTPVMLLEGPLGGGGSGTWPSMGLRQAFHLPRVRLARA